MNSNIVKWYNHSYYVIKGKLGDNIHDFKYLSCLIIINKGVLTVLILNSATL